MANSGTDQEQSPPPYPSHIDGDDYTYARVSALPPPGYDLRTGPERTAAQLAADEARLVDAEVRIEQLEATAGELRVDVEYLGRIVHRLLNADAADVLSGDAGAAPLAVAGQLPRLGLDLGWPLERRNHGSIDPAWNTDDADVLSGDAGAE